MKIWIRHEKGTGNISEVLDEQVYQIMQLVYKPGHVREAMDEACEGMPLQNLSAYYWPKEGE